MEGRTILIGGAVVVVAFALLVTQQRSGSQEAGLESRISGLTEQIGGLTEQVGGLTEQVAGLESELAEMSEQADAQAEALAESATLGSRLAETVSGMGEMSDGAGGEASPEMAAAVPEPEFDAAAAPDAARDDTADGGTAIGETAILADGAVRAFVSRVDEENQSARILANGMMQMLAVGDSMTVPSDGQDCAVTLNAVGGNTATLSADCGAA